MTCNRRRTTLWMRWVGANAIGEMLGLGGTFAVVALAFSSLENQPAIISVILSFLTAVAAGAVEATVVGLFQWWAMHPWFPAVGRRAWVLATLAGALVAYALGYLPSTLMSMAEETSQTQAVEPELHVVLLLAAGMGAVAGAVLSSAQWLVLRKRVPRAGGWIPANMVAWLLGMPVIFAGIDAAQRAQMTLRSVLIVAGSLLITGALVGSIHGAVLVRMAEPARG